MRVLLSLVCGEDFRVTRGVRDAWVGGSTWRRLGGKRKKKSRDKRGSSLLAFGSFILSCSFYTLETQPRLKEGKVHPLLLGFNKGRASIAPSASASTLQTPPSGGAGRFKVLCSNITLLFCLDIRYKKKKKKKAFK